MFPTEVKKIHFNKLRKSYEEYVELYRFFNRGSLEGVQSFSDFYWTHTYYYKYKNKTFFQGM